MKRFTIAPMPATLTLLLLAGLPGSAMAETLHVQAQWSGSLSRTASDIVDDTGDGNGLRATVSDVYQRGTLGPASVKIVSESTSQPTGYFTPNCPSAPYFVEYPYLAHSSVTRYESTGDLLFTNFIEGHACLDPYSLRFTFEVDLDIVGGTGRFLHATGQGNASGGGAILLLDAGGNIAFASLDGGTTAEIVVPD